MKILIVDLNNLIARNTNAFPRATSGDGFPVGGLYGAVNQIRFFLARQPHDAVICAADYGVPAFRKELCPEYKAQRADKRTPEEDKIYEAYKAQVPVAYKVLRPLGITTVRAKGWEGDDVIATLALKRLVDHEVTVFSSDRDFLQLVDNKRVRMFDIHRDLYRDEDRHFCLKRCMDPKDSDNLDGVRGVGEKTADKLIEAWSAECNDRPGSASYVDNFIAWCASQPQASKTGVLTAPAKCVDAQKKIRANWQCTHLPGIVDACSTALKWRKGAKDFKAFRAVCQELSLRPLLEDMSAVWPAFSRLVEATDG